MDLRNYYVANAKVPILRILSILRTCEEAGAPLLGCWPGSLKMQPTNLVRFSCAAVRVLPATVRPTRGLLEVTDSKLLKINRTTDGESYSTSKQHHTTTMRPTLIRSMRPTLMRAAAAAKSGEGNVLNQGAKRDPELYVCDRKRSIVRSDQLLT